MTPSIPHKSALLLLLDRPEWKWARAISYTATFGIEEGLQANGVACTVVPSFLELHSEAEHSWLPYIRQLFAAKQFDMVWVWLAHSKYSENFLQLLTELAPIRVGFMMESMTYEGTDDIHLNQRKELVLSQANYMTHIAVVDEVDVELVHRLAKRPAFWWPISVPSRYIRSEPIATIRDGGIFIGSAYERRKDWFEYRPLQGKLHHASSPEEKTVLPIQFERVNFSALSYLQHSIPRTTYRIEQHSNALREIRQAIFENWMNALSSNGVNVNLPSLCQCYPSRVVEGMAAGRPVASSIVPNRAKNRALFHEGEEILLFETKDELASILDRLQSDPALAQTISTNALRKVREYHSSEIRVQQFLQWLSRL